MHHKWLIAFWKKELHSNGWDQIGAAGVVGMTPTSREEEGHQTRFPTQAYHIHTHAHTLTYTQTEAHPAAVRLPDEGVMHDRCHCFLCCNSTGAGK